VEGKKQALYSFRFVKRMKKAFSIVNVSWLEYNFTTVTNKKDIVMSAFRPRPTNNEYTTFLGTLVRREIPRCTANTHVLCKFGYLHNWKVCPST
jgi:hypothetical protein